jgi:peptidoglycan/LPS O-acetylase OafA/YrhL
MRTISSNDDTERLRSGGGDWLERWHVNPNVPREYDAIDGLRGIAILLVVVCHLIYTNPASGSVVQFIGGMFAAGSWGVTLFFTLSGFLIAQPFWKRKFSGSDQVVPNGYGRRRFWKIYPPLALSILLLTPFYMLASGGRVSFLPLAGQWLIGWPLILPVSGLLNPVMWSLIVEVHFYILLPLLFLLFKRTTARTCLWLIFFLLLVVPIAFRWWNLSRGVAFQLHPEIRVHFPSMLDSFAFGVLVAGLENMRKFNKSQAWLADVGSLGFIVAIPTLSWLTLKPLFDPAIQLEALTLAVKVASGLMLFYVVSPNHPRCGLLSMRWLRWAGLISYEWYLFHQPLMLWARQWFGPAQGNLIKYLFILLVPLMLGLIVAALVYRFFSLPLLRYGRNRRGVL